MYRVGMRKQIPWVDWYKRILLFRVSLEGEGGGGLLVLIQVSDVQRIFSVSEGWGEGGRYWGVRAG